MQQTFPCPNCGRQNYIGQQFCSSCGYRFQYNCPDCRNIVDTTQASCPSCGSALYWPAQPADEYAHPRAGYQQQEYPASKRGKSTAAGMNPVLTSTIVVVVAMIIIGGAVFALTRPPGESKPGTTAPTDNTPPTQTTHTYDSTPPKISNLVPTPTSDNSTATFAFGATISWTTDEPATTRMEYGRTKSYGTTVQDSTMVTNHTVVLKDLEPNATYYFKVRSADANRNEASSDEQSFTTPPLPDTTPPTIMGVIQTTTIDASTGPKIINANIKWYTNEPATKQVDYWTVPEQLYSVPTTPEMNPGPPDPAGGQYQHIVTLINLNPNTIYYYRVKSKDAAGNETVYHVPERCRFLTPQP